MGGADRDRERDAMVERQLRARGVVAPLVLRAMARVPREAFVPERLAHLAYADSALPIARQQTISQPYIVACMLDALQLRGGERVLEVGTGSGYAAAVLAQIAGRVFTIERHEELAATAQRRLAALGLGDVAVRHGDGMLGWAEAAPFDAIVVAAGAPFVPPALSQQLAPGGRLVIPVGPTPDEQHLLRITRTGPDQFTSERLESVRFVPLLPGAAAGEREEGRSADARHGQS